MKSIMKLSTAIFSIILLPNFVIADQLESWMLLHANSQNLANKVNMAERVQLGEIEEYFEPENSNIKKALKSLVELENLIHKEFKIKYNEGLDNFIEMLDQIKELDDLHKKYGVFTSMEMLDIGKYFRGVEFAKNGEIILNVYLPKEKMRALSDQFDKVLNN